MANWADVAAVVNARMAERGLSQKVLAELSGVSVATLRQIQQGADRRRSAVTLAAISRALGFSDNHLRQVADGAGSAGVVEEPEAIAELRAEIADLRRRVAALESR